MDRLLMRFFQVRTFLRHIVLLRRDVVERSSFDLRCGCQTDRAPRRCVYSIILPSGGKKDKRCKFCQLYFFVSGLYVLDFFHTQWKIGNVLVKTRDLKRAFLTLFPTRFECNRIKGQYV